MTSMVIQVVLGVMLITVCTAQPASESAAARSGNNLILCNKELGDSSLAYSYVLTREALFLQTRTETLVWPQNELGVNPISCIRVLDQITNNMGGFVDLVRGGLGATYVELVFTSRWSRRMSFRIEIYTEPAIPVGK